MTNDASRARWRRAAGGFTAAVVAGLLLAAPSFASALGAASGIGSALPSHLDARLLYSGVGGAKGHLDHVVIVMLENHVYDTYFANYCLQVGAYCPENASGIPPGTCEPLQPTTPDAGCVRPFNFTPTNLSTVDLPHSWQSGHSAYANGSLNDFYQAEGRNLATFGHFNGSTVPTYWDIAEQYAIGDNFFASALSYSTPNHWYMVAAAAPNESLEQGLSHLPNASLTPSLDAYLNESNATPSIVPELNNASVSWSYYDWNMTGYTYNSAIHGQGGENNPDDAFDYWSPLAAQAVSYTPSMISHFKAFKTFNTDALAGRLPNVSWVVTNPLQSDHPPYPTNDAEDFVASLVNAVAEGPDWNSTAIFVTWDDYGGFYDNVPPPQIDAAGVSFRAPLHSFGSSSGDST
ncbi:MAG: hypothetical protein L3J91_01150 [Thermoplasmata archaeon]|nr:hypothetical protein [Thermoplasmata archaeon]